MRTRTITARIYRQDDRVLIEPDEPVELRPGDYAEYRASKERAVIVVYEASRWRRWRTIASARLRRVSQDVRLTPGP